MACTAGLAVAAAAAPVVGVSTGRSRRITGATTQKPFGGTTRQSHSAAAARGRAPLTVVAVVSDADAEGTMRREGSAPRRGRGGGRGGGDMSRGGRGGGG